MVEYYSFEKVLKELQMEEDELKRLVSEGEIRAFRDEDKMKFKKSDIDGLKKGRMTEPTIILPSGESDDSSEDSEVLLVEEETSETLLDIDDLENSDSSSTSVPTVDFSSSGFEDSSASETITEELKFEEDSGSYVLESSDDVLVDSSAELKTEEEKPKAKAKPAAKSSKKAPVKQEEPEEDTSGETFVDSDTGLQTEPLDVDSESNLEAADDDSEDLGTEVVDERPKKSPTKRQVRTTQPLPVAVGVVRAQPVGAIMFLVLLAGTVAMMGAGAIMINNVYGVDSSTAFITNPLYEMSPNIDFYKKFAKNPQFKDGKFGSEHGNVASHMKWRESKRSGKGK